VPIVYARGLIVSGPAAIRLECRQWEHSFEELAGSGDSIPVSQRVLEAFPMKTTVSLFVFVLCSCLTTLAQILPNGGCGCGVSSSTVSCDCPSAVNTGKPSVPSDRPQLIEARVRLAPGALLMKWVPGDDEVIIGMGSGELTNEAKSPTVDVSVSEGSIFLMPRDELYKLRNVGKTDVEVRVIRIHHYADPACQ
jgi:hypothetical protein